MKTNNYLKAYLEERARLLFPDLEKVALVEIERLEPEEYQRFVDRIVRMPGPLETPRKFKWGTPMPTEASKEQARRSLHASQEVAADVKTHTIEDIN